MSLRWSGPSSGGIHLMEADRWERCFLFRYIRHPIFTSSFFSTRSRVAPRGPGVCKQHATRPPSLISKTILYNKSIAHLPLPVNPPPAPGFTLLAGPLPLVHGANLFDDVIER